MPRFLTIQRYVTLVALISVGVFIVVWQYHEPFPGFFEFGSFVLVGVLVERLSTRLRVGAHGSIVFLIYLATAILFGGAWGSLVAGVSTGLSRVMRGMEPLKLVFNIAQRVLSVAAGVVVYRTLGGGIPPEFLKASSAVSAYSVQRDLLLFFALAATYFLVNSIAVSGAVSLSTGRPMKEVWDLNTRGMIGYDLGSSAAALILAWFYVRAQHFVPLGLGPLSLVLVVIPVVVLRHIYGLYFKLQENGRELLEVMVRAIEARDPYTSGHSIRVSTLARQIASEIGLSTRQLEEIRTAGLLHDVGKIHEEFAPLLRKEAKLTAEEFALLQTHAAKSAELVGIMSSFRGSIQAMVRSHHERWDGKGYPDGLAGQEIPLGSRVIIISDTIDAMTTDRPYRKALSLEQVIAELQRCRGTQFDPRLVDVVVSSLGIRRLALKQMSAARSGNEDGGERVVVHASSSRKTSSWLLKHSPHSE